MKKRMKKRRNLTRFKLSMMHVKINRIAKYWNRKLVKTWINEEYD